MVAEGCFNGLPIWARRGEKFERANKNWRELYVALHYVQQTAAAMGTVTCWLRGAAVLTVI